MDTSCNGVAKAGAKVLEMSGRTMRMKKRRWIARDVEISVMGDIALVLIYGWHRQVDRNVYSGSVISMI